MVRFQLWPLRAAVTFCQSFLVIKELTYVGAAVLRDLLADIGYLSVEKKRLTSYGYFLRVTRGPSSSLDQKLGLSLPNAAFFPTPQAFFMFYRLSLCLFVCLSISSILIFPPQISIFQSPSLGGGKAELHWLKGDAGPDPRTLAFSLPSAVASTLSQHCLVTACASVPLTWCQIPLF